MKSIELIAKAKINLSLDVIGKRPDGYHDVKMLMQTVELHDDVVLERVAFGIEVTCENRWVPSGSENIAYKAAALLLDKFGINEGVKIDITKRIPVAAGLAGGSSDAAAVLKGVNEIFELGLSKGELMQVGKQIGADVPYCIRGGTMLAEGIGEILTEIKPFGNVNVVLVKPKIGVPTAWVYKNLNLDKITTRPDTDLLISAITNENVDLLAKNMRNVLESVTIDKYPVIEEIKGRLLEYGARGSMMSGSGPTVFGLFSNKGDAEEAYNRIKCDRWDCYLTKTVCEEI